MKKQRFCAIFVFLVIFVTFLSGAGFAESKQKIDLSQFGKEYAKVMKLTKSRSWYHLNHENKEQLKAVHEKAIRNFIKNLPDPYASYLTASECDNYSVEKDKDYSVSGWTKSVFYISIPPDIGYIKLTKFRAGSAFEVMDAFEMLGEAGFKNFVFDLRYNPGGLLGETVKVMKYFLPIGSIIHFEERYNGRKIRRINKGLKSGSRLPSDARFVVLVNSNSASGSEILALYLKEYKKAVIIGGKTLGKLTRQDYFRLPGGACLKLTTGVFLSPVNRKELHGIGVEPDIYASKGLGAKYIWEDINTKEDKVFNKAVEILRSK